MGCSPQFSDNFEAMALFMDSKTAMECLNKLSIGVPHCGVCQFKIGFEVVDYNMHQIWKELNSAQKLLTEMTEYTT